MSSISGKRSEREDNDGERPSSSLEDDDGGDAAARKKLRLSKEQAAILEETFKEHNTLNPVSLATSSNFLKEERAFSSFRSKFVLCANDELLIFYFFYKFLNFAEAKVGFSETAKSQT